MLDKAVSLGLSGNKVSKLVTGTSEVSAKRSAVATGTGAALGAAASTGMVAVGVATAPIAIPLVAAAGIVSFVASRFR